MCAMDFRCGIRRKPHAFVSSAPMAADEIALPFGKAMVASCWVHSLAYGASRVPFRAFVVMAVLPSFVLAFLCALRRAALQLCVVVSWAWLCLLLVSLDSEAPSYDVVCFCSQGSP